MKQEINFNNLRNMSKKNIIVIVVIITFIILSATLTFYPFFNPRYASFQRNEGYEEFILTEFDLINPVYTVILNDKPNNSSDSRAVSVVRLNRNSLFTFQLNEVIVSGESQNATFEEVKEYVQKNNLVDNNPNSDIFVGNFGGEGYSEKEVNQLSNEDSYYLNYSIKPGFQKKNVEDFKKLKIGMTWEEVNNAGIFSENGGGPGFVSGKYERRARVTNENVMFMVMSFTESVRSNPDATLEGVYVVYLDRSSEKLDLETQ